MTTKSASYALFTKAEMARRYAKARVLMAARGIDALLISGEENFQYFAGTSSTIGLHYSLTRPQLFILPLENEPIIVTQMVESIVLSCYVTDLRRYEGVIKFPHEVVLNALKDAGLRNNRVGAELGQEQRMGVPVGAYLDLVKALPQTEFVDAADIIIQLRMVKSPEEVAYIRKAAEITARARQRLYDGEIRPGMTERQAVRALRRLILEEGGDRTSFCHIQNGRPGHMNQFHYDRPLERGMVIGMDTGAYYGVYTVDYPRFAVLGKATAEQKRVHEAVKYVSRKMAEALRPGVTCAEIHRVGVEACKDVDVELDEMHKRQGFRMGHGQGMLFTEPPSISEDDHTVLDPGMVLSTEPGVSGGKQRGNVEYLWEDVHVVTEDGHEQLTLEIDELREIPS
jgi:Xaa-Pro aminopeptidase